jgi:hypothetical protein
MDAKIRAIFRQAMREIGPQGGKIGGKCPLETMTPEEGLLGRRRQIWRRRRSGRPRGWRERASLRNVPPAQRRLPHAAVAARNGKGVRVCKADLVLVGDGGRRAIELRNLDRKRLGVRIGAIP